MAVVNDTDPTAALAVEVFGRLAPEGTAPPWETVADLAPALGDFVRQGVGGLLGGPGLDLRTRELATVCMLSAMGGADSQLAFHVAGALRSGATGTEVVEALAQVALYAGIPRALNGLAVARAVLAKETVLVREGAVRP